MKKLSDDCFVHDKDRMRHEEAVGILRSRMSTIATTEDIALEQAAGRILAEAIVAPRDIPAFDNSAVDGYAYSSDDYAGTGGFFPIAARIPAGHSADIELPPSSAARIFTGARMPAGSDTVAMQEDCEPHEQDSTSFVAIPPGLKPGANCRLAGEDVSAGSPVAGAGQTLRPQDLAAIASTGTPNIAVFRKLKVALISSGDEILRPGEPYEAGGVYDTNRFMLEGLLQNQNVELIDLGVCPDDREALSALLKEASQTCDAILSTGGASKGEEDHFVEALERLGKCHLLQLAIKPGRPMSFGQLENTPCFTLPGNPVAAFVCFLLYVRPSLICLGGGGWNEPTRFPMPAGFAIKSKPDRREFLRGFTVSGTDGSLCVQKFSRDGSGLISGLQAASGFIEISEERTEVHEGDIVEFIPFSQFGIYD